MESLIITKGKQVYVKALKPGPSEINKMLGLACDSKGEVPENFKCNICLLLLKDPQQCS